MPLVEIVIGMSDGSAAEISVIESVGTAVLEDVETLGVAVLDDISVSVVEVITPDLPIPPAPIPDDGLILTLDVNQALALDGSDVMSMAGPIGAT